MSLYAHGVAVVADAAKYIRKQLYCQRLLIARVAIFCTERLFLVIHVASKPDDSAACPKKVNSCDFPVKFKVNCQGLARKLENAYTCGSQPLANAMKDYFRLEISAALILKILLLTGLWFIVFRPEGKKPEPQAPVAEHLFSPISPNVTVPEEKTHDR
jgi:hypothetical protein